MKYSYLIEKFQSFIDNSISEDELTEFIGIEFNEILMNTNELSLDQLKSYPILSSCKSSYDENFFGLILKYYKILIGEKNYYYNMWIVFDMTEDENIQNLYKIFMFYKEYGHIMGEDYDVLYQMENSVLNMNITLKTIIYQKIIALLSGAHVEQEKEHNFNVLYQNTEYEISSEDIVDNLNFIFNQIFNKKLFITICFLFGNVSFDVG